MITVLFTAATLIVNEIQLKLFHFLGTSTVDERKTTICTEKSRCCLSAPYGQFCIPQRPKDHRPIDKYRHYPGSALLDSPDLSPCDLYLLGFLKKSIKGRELTTEDHIIEAIPTIW
jgi:hypothetical protein